MRANARGRWEGWCWNPSTSWSPAGLPGPDSRTSPGWTSGVGRCWVVLEPLVPIANPNCTLCCSHCRGRSPEWYNKAFGHLCANEAQTIRSSFHLLNQTSIETKTWTPGVGLYFGLCFQSIWNWLQVTPDGDHTCKWGLGVFPGCWAILECHCIESFSHLFNDQFSKTSSCIWINVWCFLQLISFRTINYWKKVSTNRV